MAIWSLNYFLKYLHYKIFLTFKFWGDYFPLTLRWRLAAIIRLGQTPRHLFIMQTESLPSLDWTQNNQMVLSRKFTITILHKDVIFLHLKPFVMVGEVWNVESGEMNDVESLYGRRWHSCRDCSLQIIINLNLICFFLTDMYSLYESKPFYFNRN